MPTFGDFETIGEPISVIEQSGHVSTVWRAHQSGRDGEPTHAIKCFAPHRRQTGESESADALDQDRGLEFLEGVKQIKKAQAEGGRNLTPIHAFGFADAGAWYVTDFYARGTLKAWIARHGSVDHAALRQVVMGVVNGCLALKRARGFSHGNLKAANVFLVGKPQPLRKTPLALADAYPCAPLQLARLATEEKHAMDDLRPQAMEVQDLRALGELLLQLVEGRLVSSAYDYNYPVAATTAWERLGSHAESWRDLTNRLLDPRLTLENINLESLAREFRPSAVAGKLPLIVGVGVGVVVLAGGIFVLAGMMARSGERKFAASLQAATNAFNAGNWVLAQREIDAAVKRQPANAAARDWKAKIGTRLEQDYDAAIQSGRAALATNLDEATRWSKRATELRPTGQEALALQTQISTVRSRREADEAAARKQAELQAKYDTALKASQLAFDRGDFKIAFDKAGEALGYKSGDAAATKLRNEADAQLKSQADRQAKYDAALKTGQTAFSRGEYQVAYDKAVEALSYRSGDPAATKLKNDADSQLRSAADRQAKYEEALKAGQTAFNRGEFKEAYDKAVEALSYKAGDSTATKLRNDADSQLKSAADRMAKYEAALKAAQAALAGGEFKIAFDKAVEALSYKPGDEVATKLKDNAGAQLKSAIERSAKYDAALKAGQTAFAGGDFKLASEKAAEALSYKSGDVTATKLKEEAESQLKAVAERTAKYDASLKAGQTAFAAGEFQTAYDKAVEALSYKSGDTTATRLKENAETQLKAAAARLANYDTALKAGQAAFARGDFQLAFDKAVEALSYKTGDSTATKLKNDAASELSRVARQQRYDTALAAAQAALREATTALASTNFALVKTRIAAGLQQCAIARTNGDPASVASLEQSFTALRAKSESKQADTDYQRADALRLAGKVPEALALCKSYPGPGKFQDLGRTLTNMQETFDRAQARFKDGDYGYLRDIESREDGKNPWFEPLITGGQREKAQLDELTKLRNSGQWKELSAGLDRLKEQARSAWDKRSFQDLVTWVTQNDPMKKLDRDLLILKIKLGLDTRTVLNDPATGKPMRKLPPTAVVDGYHSFLDKLEQENPTAYQARRQDIDDIRAAINNWR